MADMADAGTGTAAALALYKATGVAEIPAKRWLFQSAKSAKQVYVLSTHE